MKYRINILAQLLLVWANVFGQGPAETIPEFNFYKLQKGSFTNKDLVPGKMAFFIFFDSDCDHCQHAMQYLNQHYHEFKKAAIHLVTLDDQEKITRFIGKYGNNLKDKKDVTILRDTRNEFIHKFRPRKYPALFLYSAKKELILYDDNEQNLFRFSQQINTPGK
ncbi:TlpA family protein disulfide reductase [Terrimonas pollutisoli]|uniref:TlpA family protein disulfide reductase n=1 Tax=Terrimonas pollutisoli TaxID=3034147 RepID=UPI0023EDC66D|nr:redoxin domain-containing protein [Terrimonas sp. H1YJ31]